MGSTAVQAHRGSPDPVNGVRENTLAAFARARRLGADGVELDVRMTADGELAVHHDPVVDGAGTICELTAAELPSFVPLLRAALGECEGLIVNVEIKNLPGDPGFDPGERVAREVVDLVVATGRVSSVIISSFWPDTLAAVRDAHADLPTGLLLASWFDPADAVGAATSRGCTALHPHIDLAGPALVGAAHAAGLTVAAWTVNDRARLVEAAEAGVDTVITDDVVLALGMVGPGRPGF
jgi:glycerophosphoryl diester phosphodiesterase